MEADIRDLGLSPGKEWLSRVGFQNQHLGQGREPRVPLGPTGA